MIFLPALQPLMPAAALSFITCFYTSVLTPETLAPACAGGAISEVPRSLLLLLRPKLCMASQK